MSYPKYIILIIFLFTMISANADSYGKCGNGAHWEMTNDGVLTITGNGPMSNMSRSSTPWRPDLVRNVIIGEGIDRIGNNCFNSCKNLQQVQLPATLKTIGASAFANCRKLVAVNFPIELSSIEDRAFENCENITTISFPASLGMLGERSFSNCKSLAKIEFFGNIKSIGSNAFDKCQLVTELNGLPNFIQPANCIQYGLSSAIVERFYLIQKRLSSKNKETNHEYKTVVSDVDIELPRSLIDNKKRHAFIIANEEYPYLANVPYAEHDGNKFSEYCNQVLGIPKTNIHYYENATYGTLQRTLLDIKDVDDAFEGDTDLIIYYVGHGVPDDATKEAFIVPSDASEPNPKMCLSLPYIYEFLGKLKARSTIVFLDACFSGASRDYSMLNYGERGVRIKPKVTPLTGNVAVISATAGNQTAQPYEEKGHGLFTYYLLKVLKETKGNASLGTIKNYVSQNVRQTSAGNTFKSQSPTANISPDVVDSWEDWKLK